MIRATIFWLGLCCLQTESSGTVEQLQEMVGILGESANFHLDISAPFRQMFWRTDVTLASVVHPCKLDILNVAYEGRLNASQDCRTFTLTHLRKKDSDTYHIEIIGPGRHPSVKKFGFRVYKRLSENDLRVDCAKHGLSAGNETWQLNCSAPAWEDGVGYNWTLGSESEVVSSGRYLVIPQGLEDGDQNFTCRARNPVSNTSRTFSRKQCGNGGEQTTATRIMTMGTANPGEEITDGPSALTTAVIIVAVCALLAVLVCIILWQKKKKKAAQKTFTNSATHSEPDEFTKTIYSQVENIPEQRKTSKPQQRRGLTPSEDALQTVYITVQHPKETPLQTDDEKMLKGNRKPRAEREKTVYSEITKQPETEDQTPKTIYETVKPLKPPDGKEYNKIL